MGENDPGKIVAVGIKILYGNKCASPRCRHFKNSTVVVDEGSGRVAKRTAEWSSADNFLTFCQVGKGFHVGNHNIVKRIA